MNEYLTTPQHKAYIGYWVSLCDVMNGYLTTPQHKAYISYWVSLSDEWIFNDTPAQNLHRLLGVIM